MKTLVLEKMPDKFWELVVRKNLSKQIIANSDLIEKEKVEAIILRTRINCDEKFINDYPQVKVIIRAGTGFDNIDIEYMGKKGIAVCNTPNANAQSAFEHTLSLILSVMKQLNFSRNNVLNGKWKSNLNYNLEFEDLKSLVVGVGRIGTKVVEALKYLNSEVKGVDPLLNDSERKEKKIEFVSFEEGLKWANLITFHCPLTDLTYHYFNRNSLDMISSPIILINASRGSIVEEESLIEGLKRNKFFGIGLDVYESEPVPKNHFKNYENVYFTPHTGAFSEKAKIRMSFETLEVWEKFKNKEDISSRIV